MATKTATLDTFVWEGKDKKGNKVKGESSGANPNLVKADLRRQGINPLKVRKKPKSLFGDRKKPITPKDIAIFSRQMATMMASGVPLVQSFDIIGKGHEKLPCGTLCVGNCTAIHNDCGKFVPGCPPVSSEILSMFNK